ncbi:UNVERIFIED_CONTAM: hypothetical protein K2H54_023160 [Gekko kuhli]
MDVPLRVLSKPFGTKAEDKMVEAETVLLVLCALWQANGCFQLITPSRWGARPANCSAPLKDILPENVIIIHTAGTPCHTKDECSRETRNVQDYHQRTKGWCDIAYSFLIGEDGYVYEGRGWRAEGAHTLGYNDLSLGVAFIGLFTGTCIDRPLKQDSNCTE